ncbi:MAG TPA: PIG-L deacetylase family protein [Myxococcaceae bacterium]|nr:PIG-L deacetylase family protein [Myxococcaceae bacterium]
MQRLSLFGEAWGVRRILALGAHADDIEIGCGGTLLRLLSERSDLEVTWVVFCSTPERAREAAASAEQFLAGASRKRIVVKTHRDGFLPVEWAQVKEEFEELKREVTPDLILTHYREDRHQDHRVVSELTWNTWRNHLILEFEIPKYDGDFGTPNTFVPLSPETLERKIELVLKAFPTQAGKAWFTADLFRAVARVRGMECQAETRLAEAFYGRKLVV